jgi:hypothetical protein
MIATSKISWEDNMVEQLTLSFYLILIGCLSCYSQQPFLKLIEKDYREISAIEYKLDKKGNAKKHGVLTSHLLVDKKSRKVFGTERMEMTASHEQLKNSYLWIYNEFYFDSLGQLNKHLDRAVEQKADKEGREINIDSSRNVELYEYDRFGNLLRDTYSRFTKTYAISRITRDTSIYEDVETQIYSTVYDDKGRPTKNYFRQQTDESNKLNSEWFYFESGQLEKLISYTNDGRINSKEVFQYDDKNRLIRKIDSTGWCLKNPSLEKLMEYRYEENDLLKVITKGIHSNYEEIQNFSEPALVRPSAYSVIQTSNGLRMKYKISFDNNQIKQYEYRWIYDEDGFLREKYLISYPNPDVSRVTCYSYK